MSNAYSARADFSPSSEDEKKFVFWRKAANVSVYLTMPGMFLVPIGGLAFFFDPEKAGSIVAIQLMLGSMWAAISAFMIFAAFAQAGSRGWTKHFYGEIDFVRHLAYYRTLAIYWNPVTAPFRMLYLVVRPLFKGGREIHTINLA